MDHFSPATGFALLAVAASLLLVTSAARRRNQRVLRGPPRLQGGDDKAVQLVYQPDSLPGARDVDTPYGCVRVYEFGPEHGPKVLLVHGITTPCLPLAPLAHALVDRGCRVMLFDLFGRGFSDGVGDLPHDARLYVSQMLCVVASSPLPWTGHGALRLIGYSMGGAIAIHFAIAFPHLVGSLVLLAPAGLIRFDAYTSVARRLALAGAVPEFLLAAYAAFRLRSPLSTHAPASRPALAVAAAEAEVSSMGSTHVPLEDSVSDYVRWMIGHHPGFVPAFLSCMRHAPLNEQHEAWRRLATRPPRSTAVLLAEDDELISPAIYAREGLPLAGGPDRVVWKVLPGTHDFIMTHVDPILDELDSLWQMKKPA
ncbi:C6 and C2H2 transcription factor regA-like protein [Ophiocordyceps camponoti-floridani]|uniref:C6 and C2H2 transcription factor regA-like protein n=1 Tax=Ophiocordyceps camponoti-floridani TaxID=2030778 RepID=A0A8H4QC53_9HYPO|nr:C6 and C2H2 transcription factor regA-like protein [Ophiocordyceps camponoti-floridani]